MKLYNLLQIRTTLNAHTKDTMSTMLAYKIMKFIKSTEAEENFYNEKIQEILLKYGAKDENGNYIKSENGIKIIDDKVDDCHKEVNELAATEVEVPAITFTIDKLSQINLTVAELYTLDEIIQN